MNATIPYIAHEAALARAERNSKRQQLIIVALTIMLVASIWKKPR